MKKWAQRFTNALWSVGSAGGIDKELNAVEGDGRLFSLEKGRLSEKLGPFNLSNGMGWSRDNKVMYFVDSLPHRKIYALDYDAASGSVCKYHLRNCHDLFGIRSCQFMIKIRNKIESDYFRLQCFVR